ncbi:MAG TPA: hypothetical protein DCS31_08355 [Candidatus Competibacteraceae bacterium]|jgi:hypothetical protein|nr:hypothetical protein [Candidatus Competibacteraceae bacterium]
MVAKPCPICGSAPRLIIFIPNEHQYECASMECDKGVYEFVEAAIPEEQCPLTICRTPATALEQWNQCVDLYLEHHQAAVAA